MIEKVITPEQILVMLNKTQCRGVYTYEGDGHYRLTRRPCLDYLVDGIIINKVRGHVILEYWMNEYFDYNNRDLMQIVSRAFGLKPKSKEYDEYRGW
jgi:hypothetical protein